MRNDNIRLRLCASERSKQVVNFDMRMQCADDADRQNNVRIAVRATTVVFHQRLVCAVVRDDWGGVVSVFPVALFVDALVAN